VLGMIRGEKLKPIAIASEHRSPLLPDVPTFRESGLDYTTGTWFGLLAPARTPEEIVGLLHRTAIAILQDKAARTKILEEGADVVASSPTEFRTFLRQETDRLSAVIRAANIALD
jgi:tripartite-type tricarboxylate transporter receptor subunit TctC